MSFQPNQQIGNYTLIKKIGEGGFGEVWLAENRNNPSAEKVAIKLPLKEQLDLQTVKEEIFNWTLAGKHKNILPFIECETFGNQIAIVSEYAPDGSLGDLLKKHRVFSVADAVEIIVGILDGLGHLHNRKIIHRDLKPDNVLFQGRIPRLADFGISRALPVNSQSATVSGTLAYMALECFDGKRNEQTDIWAVGAMLYQLLTGKLPFPQKTQEERIFAMVMNHPDSLPDSFPRDLQNIVKKSLEKETANRYQNAEVMRKDLSDLWGNLYQSVFAEVSEFSNSEVTKKESQQQFKRDSIETQIISKSNEEQESLSPQKVFEQQKSFQIIGIVPLVLFAISHIFTTSKAMNGEKIYNDAVADTQHSPFMFLLEILFVFLPLLLHFIYVFFYSPKNKPNNDYKTDWIYLFYRITGVVFFLFLIFHIFHLRFALLGNLGLTNVPVIGNAYVAFTIVSADFQLYWVLILYIIGVLATFWHLTFGAFLFLIDWKVLVNRNSKKLAFKICLGIVLIFSLIGINTTFAFIRPCGLLPMFFCESKVEKTNEGRKF